jgi:hypothetical protein
MEKSPWSEAGNCSDGQETDHFSQNLKFHYQVHNSLPVNPTLSQMNPVYTLISCSLRFILILFFHQCLGLSKWSLPFTFHDYNFVCISHLPHVSYMSHPHHSPWFDCPNNIWWRVKLWSSSLCNFLHCPFTSPS